MNIAAAIIAADVVAIQMWADGVDSATAIHAALERLDASGWADVVAAYGMLMPRGQVAQNVLYGWIMVRATGDHRYDYSKWTAEDYRQLFAD